MVLAVGNDAQWVAAMRALGLPDLADDEALRTNAGRLAQRDRIVSRLSAHMRRADSIEWIRRLDAAGVPCGLVREVHEALEPVTASARTGMPPLWNGRVRLEPPGLGQHTVTIREKRWRIFDELPIPE